MSWNYLEWVDAGSDMLDDRAPSAEDLQALASADLVNLVGVARGDVRLLMHLTPLGHHDLMLSRAFRWRQAEARWDNANLPCPDCGKHRTRNGCDCIPF